MTHLGQLPFILFTQMARTWAIQEDSVNTSIIHWYSTLPCNGRIHRLSKSTGINKGSRTSRFCSSRQDPKAEDRTGRVGRAEADRRWTDVGCPKPSCAMSGFNRTILCRRDRNRSAERHLIIPSATLSVVDIFSKLIFPEMTQSRTKWYRTSICLEVLWWTGFFDKATALWLSL